jgi:myo-inositol 2-dehydrogenase/D-chiro-inositol 1-dehydrogenase
MAFLLAGRTAAHGYAVESELIGTKGALRVASVPQADLVEQLDGRGVVRECSQSFLERFQDAFLAEAREFASCLRQGRRPEPGVRDGLEATRVAAAAMESFRTDRLVRLGE